MVQHLVRSSINSRTARLIYVSDGDPSEASSGIRLYISISILGGREEVHVVPPMEPSTIFTRLPVAEPANTEDVPPLGYFPSYSRMTPEQRWKYLHWLTDISQPVDIGYVFTYYYGLERRLLEPASGATSNRSEPAKLLAEPDRPTASSPSVALAARSENVFELAFSEIRLLQTHHQHKSFAYYSNSALLHGAILIGRRDKFSELVEDYDRPVQNTELLAALFLEAQLSSFSLMRVARVVSGINRTFMSKDQKQFENSLDECLRER